MYIGVDIGGTSIKMGVVDDNCNITSELEIPTGAERHQNIVFEDILNAVKKLSLNNNIKAVGIDSPGMIDTKSGTVIYNNNLNWIDFHIGAMMSEALNLPVTLDNDADAAALGEAVAGSAKGSSRALIVTLGTGVGSGFIVDGKIFSGCEFGHMVVQHGGRLCTCGRKGCFEMYASATGLIISTKEAIEKYPDSKLARMAEAQGKITGKTAFDAADEGDKTALEVVNNYIDYLACGLANYVNGLHPEIISIGGGISKQGDSLLNPLRERIKPEIYGYKHMKEEPVKILACTLGNKAGLIGAAMSAKQVL